MDHAELLLTALHEAGHAVAHVRLGIDQENVTIVPGDNTLGHSTSAGVESVWSQEEAENMVIAYCAGYAAMVAAGHGEEVAKDGCDADFVKADQLIQQWGLTDRAGWQAKAVELMSTPANVAAVRMVAEHLVINETLDAGYVDVIVDVADGEITEAEFERYVVRLQAVRR